MCTYNAISSHTDHFEIQKRDSEESLLSFVNLFLERLLDSHFNYHFVYSSNESPFSCVFKVYTDFSFFGTGICNNIICADRNPVK